MRSGEPVGADPDVKGYGAAGCVAVLPDPESLALALATAVVAEARRAANRRGRFDLALAGGNTPQLAYRLLGGDPFADRVPWESTHVFWGDERCVGPDDARSNQRMAREALLDRVPIPAEQVHPIRFGAASAAGGSGIEKADRLADQAARDYEALLRERDVNMDLVLLGLGEDGHTASLFPGAQALSEQERWVMPALQVVSGEGSSAGASFSAAGAPPTTADAPLWRVTLTASYINRAACVFFVVSGTSKAGVLGQVVGAGVGDVRAASDATQVLPARLIRPASGRLWWFVDEAAASGLDRGRLWWPR